MKLARYSKVSHACYYVAQAVRRRLLSPQFRFNPREVRVDFVVGNAARRRDFL